MRGPVRSREPTVRNIGASDVAADETNNMSDLSVLVVDDNRATLSLLRSTFRYLGIDNIVLFESADEALQYLDGAVPDLVVTDWEMSPMSGLELVRAIRSHAKPEIRRVPIIMVTAHSDPASVTSARDAGITEFLVKPFSLKSIEDKLRSVVRRPRPFIRTIDYAGPDRRRTGQVPVSTDRRLEDGGFFDFTNNYIGTAKGGLASAIPAKDLLAQFEVTLAERVALIVQVSEDAQRDESERRLHVSRLYRMVHDLKGQGTTFGYPLLTQLGAIMCDFISEANDVGEEELAIVKMVVEAIKIVSENHIRQSGGETGRALVAKLDTLVREHKRPSVSPEPQRAPEQTQRGPEGGKDA